MSNFNKVFNSKIILLIVICVSLVTNTAYGIDFSRKLILRKPLDFNNINETGEGRYRRALMEAVGSVDNAPYAIPKEQSAGSEEKSFINLLRDKIFFCNIAAIFENRKTEPNVFQRLNKKFEIGGVQFDSLELMGHWKKYKEFKPAFIIRLKNTFPKKTIKINVPDTNIFEIKEFQGVDIEVINSDKDAGIKIWRLVREAAAPPATASSEIKGRLPYKKNILSSSI